MHRLEFLQLVFETRIEPHEIRDFHAAAMDFLGWEYDGLPSLEERRRKRNSKPETLTGYPDYSFDYPLAQVKLCYYRGSYHPMLIYLGPDADEIKACFCSAWHTSVSVNHRSYLLRIAEARMQDFSFRAGRDWTDYYLYNYRALNAGNRQEFEQLKKRGQGHRLIQKQLAADLRTFVRGVGWQVNVPIEITNLHLLRQQEMPLPGTRYPCFDLSFRCNLLLPEYIGLGKGAVKGFGIVRLDKRGAN